MLSPYHIVVLAKTSLKSSYISLPVMVLLCLFYSRKYFIGFFLFFDNNYCGDLHLNNASWVALVFFRQLNGICIYLNSWCKSFEICVVKYALSSYMIMYLSYHDFNRPASFLIPFYAIMLLPRKVINHDLGSY